MAGIYIHIPFCRQACSYCDFYFVTRQQLLPDFVQSLREEIYTYRNTSYTQHPVETLYIGGGTPSLLSGEQLQSILDALNETFQLQLREFTFELNPDDVSASYLQMLKHNGVTRPSMGIQSFQPELLQFMHRAHTCEEALESILLLSEASFSTWSVDIIYGNPGQSLAALQKDVNTFLRFNPPHISAYSLTIEPNTRLGKLYQLDRLEPLSDEQTAIHYDYIYSATAEAGIHRYEISNYSRSGHEALHNTNYWKHCNYLGFGPGAHSFWWPEDSSQAKRWNNVQNIRQYLSSEQPPQEIELLTLGQLAEEYLMLSLRTRSGVKSRRLAKVYEYNLSARQQAYLDELEHRGYVSTTNNHIRLSQEGTKLADTITLTLITKK